MKNEKPCEQILSMLEKSEARIDRTNEMICKFAESAIQMAHAAEKHIEELKLVINEYNDQLERLQRQRDMLTEQNGELIRLQSKFVDILAQRTSVSINNN